MATIPLPVSKTIISTSVWGIPITNQVNTNTNGIATNTSDLATLKPQMQALRGIPVVRLQGSTAVTFDANARYKLATPGFTASGAMAMGSQPDFPAFYTLYAIDATGVTYSAHHPDGSKWPSAYLGFQYVIFGPAP